MPRTISLCKEDFRSEQLWNELVDMVIEEDRKLAVFDNNKIIYVNVEIRGYDYELCYCGETHIAQSVI